MKNFHDRQRTGYTLIELAVVMAIIATLSAIGAPVAVGAMRSRDMERALDLVQRGHALAQGLAQRRVAPAADDVRFGVALFREDDGAVEIAVIQRGPIAAGAISDALVLTPDGDPVFRVRLPVQVRVGGVEVAVGADIAWFYADRSGSVVAPTGGRFQAAAVGQQTTTMGTPSDPWQGLVIAGTPVVITPVMVAPPVAAEPGLELRNSGGTQRRQVIINTVGVLHDQAL